MHVPARGSIQLQAQKSSDAVSMTITEGESRLAWENREIGFFTLEKGTLSNQVQSSCYIG